MVTEEIELSDSDIIVILEESETTQPGTRAYAPDLEYGSDPQWSPPEPFETSWNEGEDTWPGILPPLSDEERWK